MPYEKIEFDFSKYWAIFCFWKEQFEQKRVEWVQYADCWYWLLAPKDVAKQMIQDFDHHNREEAKRRLEIMWIDAIIRYEYNNYECEYAFDIEPLQFLIETYGTTWRTSITC